MRAQVAPRGPSSGAGLTWVSSQWTWRIGLTSRGKSDQWRRERPFRWNARRAYADGRERWSTDRSRPGGVGAPYGNRYAGPDRTEDLGGRGRPCPVDLGGKRPSGRVRKPACLQLGEAPRFRPRRITGVPHPVGPRAEFRHGPPTSYAPTRPTAAAPGGTVCRVTCEERRARKAPAGDSREAKDLGHEVRNAASRADVAARSFKPPSRPPRPPFLDPRRREMAYGSSSYSSDLASVRRAPTATSRALRQNHRMTQPGNVAP